MIISATDYVLYLLLKKMCEFKYHHVKILKITEMKQTVKKQMYSMIVSVIVCILLVLKWYNP